MVFSVDFEMLIFKRPFESEHELAYPNRQTAHATGRSFFWSDDSLTWSQNIRLGCSCLASFTSRSQKFPEMVAFLDKKKVWNWIRFIFLSLSWVNFRRVHPVFLLEFPLGNNKKNLKPLPSLRRKNLTCLRRWSLLRASTRDVSIPSVDGNQKS